MFEIEKSKILTLNIDNKEFNKLVNSDKLIALMPNVAMSLLILKLKIENNNNNNKNNDWINDYLNVLPLHFNTPMYFSLDEIKMLQASQSFTSILLHIRSIARQYAYLVNFFELKVNSIIL